MNTNYEVEKIAKELEEQNRQLKYRNWLDAMKELHSIGALTYEQYKEALVKYINEVQR